ncbi:oligosaccharide flippase family protein [Sporosarcina sp. ACRSL]|uniref:lipopolysaccharide biosynthesis protein n=1 Tax=Sporosarcina sp. ACRSL TaxID=2918215 RepID=UPI001EF5E614|nr:oligosaccharide flippase family protein [Sporosarcina sp. ACRSL]MCG7343987.1 oligosaccharide flippase family protein [Sporosarcina sp. ACRSL]
MKNKKNKNFIKNVLTIAKGTATGQLILFLASPILSRIYTPEEYGVLAIYTLLISTLSILSTLKLELAMQTEEKDTRSIFIVKVSMIFNIIFSVTLLVIFHSQKELLSKLLKIPIESSGFLYLIPLGVFALGLNRINSSLYIRNKNFNDLKKLFVSNSILMVTIQMALGVLKVIPNSLIIGDAIGRLITNIRAIRGKLTNTKTPKLSFPNVVEVIKEKRKYVFLSTSSEFLFVLVNQSIPFLLILFYSPILAGYYTFGLKIVNAPMVLIGKSISQVYISEIRTETKRYSKINNLFNQIVKRLIVTAILPYSLLFFFGPEIFSVIFGSEWSYSGELMSIMSILFFVEIIVYPLTVTLEVLEKQNFLFIWQLSRGITTIAAFSVLNLLEVKVELTLFVVSLLLVIFYVIVFVYIKKVITSKEEHIEAT